MQYLIKIEILLLIFLIVSSSSCQSPQYKIVERCDYIRSLEICRCSKYDFNLPKKIKEAYSMPLSYCEEKRVTFSFDDWQKKIVPTREAKKHLEDRAQKKLKKR